MIDVQNITAGYDGRAILKNISFSLNGGEIAGLLGPNGAGKTTLIRALNGTVPIMAGSITVAGQSLAAMSRAQVSKKIAVVAQENETKFPVTVREFVLSGRFARGGAFGWESADDLAAAAEALSECDLDDHRDRLMNELSGGERQRVVLARALAAETPILLLDEPTANLDLAHQAMMFSLVKRRCRDRGVTAVIITHDLNLASEFADEIILLKAGSVVSKGPPEQVFNTENMRQVFDVRVLLDENPVSGKTRVTTIY